jgi:hypothetical protein
MSKKFTEKPLFIIGNPRSGTSLLRLMLTSNSKICIPPECGFIQWWHAKYENWNKSDSENSEKISEFIKDLSHSKKIETWNLKFENVSTLIAEHLPENYAQLCICVIKAYSLQNGKNTLYFGDKNNYYTEYIDLLKNIYPEAKFVSIVRDVRDVVCSYLDVNSIPQNLAYKPEFSSDEIEIAKSWHATNNNILSHAQQSRNWLLVKYEDLLENPEKTLHLICDFLEISYENSMLEYNLLNKEPKEMMAWKQKTEEKPDLSRVGRFKNMLSADVQIKIMYHANVLMRKLGYNV